MSFRQWHENQASVILEDLYEIKELLTHEDEGLNNAFEAFDKLKDQLEHTIKWTRDEGKNDPKIMLLHCEILFEGYGIFIHRYAHDTLVEWYKDALEIIGLDNEENNNIKALLLSYLGSTYGRQDEYEKAIKCFSDAQELSDCIDIQGNIMVDLADTLIRKGDIARGLETCKRLLKIAKNQDDRKSEAGLLLKMAHGYKKDDHFDLAMDAAKKSCSAARSVNDKLGEATGLSMIGVVASHIGDFDLAIESHRNSLSIYHNLNTPNFIVGSYLDLAITYQRAEDFDKAIEYFNEVLPLANEVLSPIQRAELIHNKLAICYYEKQMYQDAYEQLMRVINIAQECENVELGLVAMTGIAKMQARSKITDEMEKGIKKLIEIFSFYENDRVIEKMIHISIDIGTIFIVNRRYKDAEYWLIKASNLARDIDDQHLIAEAQELLLQTHSSKERCIEIT